MARTQHEAASQYSGNDRDEGLALSQRYMS
jgi:hypothetical protein